MGQKSNMHLDYEIIHDRVTGSCIKCTLRLPNKKAKFLVDFGMFQEKDYISKNDILNFDPSELSYVFLTHIHTDHCGRLPMLYRNGYNNKIHMTNISKILLPVSLNNTCEILNHSKNGNAPIYNKSDLNKTYKNLRGYEYNELIKLDENISIMFLSNGHLFGAASIFMKFSYPDEEDYNVIFTGDYSSKNIFFEVSNIPKFILDSPITIIQEATYGNVRSDEIEEVFVENIKKAVKQNKTILLPAFSIGRYQKAEYLIKCLQKQKIIPRRYKIYLDGVMPHEYNEKLEKLSKYFKPQAKDFTPYKSFKVVSTLENEKNSSNKSKKRSSKHSKKRKYKNSKMKSVLRKSVIESTAPKIVISSSGMGSHGPSHEYIINWMSRSDVLIHFLGYMAENTLGRILQDTLPDGCNNDFSHAEVKFTSEMSDHAKQDELLAFLENFKKINFLGINHGSNISTKEYEKVTKKCQNVKESTVLKTNTIYRVGHYGLIKVISKC